LRISARVRNAPATHETLVRTDGSERALVRRTDAAAEIHNTLRAGVKVTLEANDEESHGRP
jgi:hypothetical protein